MAFLPRETFKIETLDGGLNTTDTDITCPPNMSPYLTNVVFDDRGAATLGPGVASFLTNLGTAQVDCLHTYYNGGSEYLVASQSALVSVATAAATGWSVVTGSTGVFTAGVDVCMRTVEDEVYMTNGYATPHRYDGSALYTVGVSAYTGGITGTVAATATGGSFLAGSYYYGISGENSNSVESTVATFTTLVTVVTGGAVNLSGLPAFFPASADVGTRYLYRTTAGSQTEFYRVTALTSTQTSFTDTFADTSLVTEAQYDNGTPPKCAFWWYHRGRMFGAGDPSYPYRVYYSSAGYPEIWPAANFLEIGKGDGMPITAVAILGNSLVVHKSTTRGQKQSIWLIYMPDSTDATDASNWYIVRSPSAYAAAGWKSVTFFENMMAFLNRGGVYAFTGDDIARGPATSQIGQYAADSLAENIKSKLMFAGTQVASDVPAVTHDDKMWFGARYTSSEELLSYDFVTASKQRGVGAWSAHTGAQGTGQTYNTLEVFNKALMGGGSDGTVYKHGATYSLCGSDTLVMNYRTPHLAGNKKDWEYTKVWKNLYLTVSNVAAADFNITAYDPLTDSTYLLATYTTGTARRHQVLKIPIVMDSGGPIVGPTVQIQALAYGRATFSTATVPIQIHRMELEYLLRSRRT